MTEGVPSSSPNLTNELLEDLSNPSISALDLCQLHHLKLADLAAILDSEQFHSARDSLERIAAARTAIIALEAKALAAARLTDILKDKPQSPAHSETQRKAACKLLATPKPPKTRRKRPSPKKSLQNQSFAYIQNENQLCYAHSVHQNALPTGSPRQESTMLKLPLALLAAITLPATAQSFNIEWGSPETAPPATYGAEGLAGVWNTINLMPNFQRFPLVGLDGQPVAADIMNIGFDIIESADIPTTAGDDEALLDDCITSFNDPIDGCLFMRFLEPGDYRVIMYSLAPDDTALLSRLRIDQNAEDPEFVGGAWSGAHENGITFMSQIATVGADGKLDIHSGLISSNARSVLNGIQVIQLAQPCSPDLDGNGELDIFDVLAFLDAFNNADPAADFTGDGSFDIFDVLDFLDAFNAGCP